MENTYPKPLTVKMRGVDLHEFLQVGLKTGVLEACALAVWSPESSEMLQGRRKEEAQEYRCNLRLLWNAKG